MIPAFFTSLICILFCAVFYGAKGGQLAHVFTNFNAVKAKSKFYDRLLGGKFLSTLLFGLFIWALTLTVGAPYDAPEYLPLRAAAAWALSVAPSIGEEIGAIGGYLGWWGKYKDLGLTRSFGWKKGIQRGVWMGACFALAFNFLPALWVSLAFVPVTWLATSIQQKRLGIVDPDWWLAELFVGGIVIGLTVSLFFV